MKEENLRLLEHLATENDLFTDLQKTNLKLREQTNEIALQELESNSKCLKFQQEILRLKAENFSLSKHLEHTKLNSHNVESTLRKKCKELTKISTKSDKGVNSTYSGSPLGLKIDGCKFLL